MKTLQTNISIFSNAFADEPDEAITLEAFFQGVHVSEAAINFYKNLQ